MKKYDYDHGEVIAWVTVIFIGLWIIGYLMNIYKIMNSDSADTHAEIAFRMICTIFFPLGGLVGWF